MKKTASDSSPLVIGASELPQKCMRKFGSNNLNNYVASMSLRQQARITEPVPLRLEEQEGKAYDQGTVEGLMIIF